MPRDFRGRPSKGCEMCRSRRVKCDEKKPVCLKCAKGNRSCVYRDIFEVSIRNETADVAKRAQSAWRQRAKQPRDENDEASTPLSDQSNWSPISSTSIRSSPTPSLKPDRHQLVHARLFYDYTLPTDPLEPFKGIMDHLQPLYFQAPENSALREAVAAVSYENFARRLGKGGLDDELMASNHYGNALIQVKKAMQSEETANSDQLLLAVYLLGMYETMMARATNRFLETHASGLAALLMLRGVPMPSEGIKFRTWIICHMQMLAHCLHLGRRSFIPQSKVRRLYWETGMHFTKLLGYLHQGADLIADLQNGDTDTSTFEASTVALQQLTELDEQLIQWSTYMPPGWDVEEQVLDLSKIPSWLQEIFEKPGAPTIVLQYDNIAVAYAWNTFRVLRILVNRSILNLGRQVQAQWPDIYPHFTLRTGAALVNISRLAEDICDSIVMHLMIPIPGKVEEPGQQDMVAIRAFLLSIPLNVLQVCYKTFSSRDPRLKPRAEWVDYVVRFVKKFYDRQEDQPSAVVST